MRSCHGTIQATPGFPQGEYLIRTPPAANDVGTALDFAMRLLRLENPTLDAAFRGGRAFLENYPGMLIAGCCDDASTPRLGAGFTVPERQAGEQPGNLGSVFSTLVSVLASLTTVIMVLKQ